MRSYLVRVNGNIIDLNNAKLLDALSEVEGEDNFNIRDAASAAWCPVVQNSEETVTEQFLQEVFDLVDEKIEEVEQADVYLRNRFNGTYLEDAFTSFMEFEDFEHFDEYIDRYIMEQEVIGYDNAWEYIENAAGYHRAVDLAKDYGYEKFDDCGLETLATILYQDDMRNEYSKLREEVEQFFYHFDNELEVWHTLDNFGQGK